SSWRRITTAGRARRKSSLTEPVSTSYASARPSMILCVASASSRCARRQMLKLPFVKMHGCGNDYIYIVADRVRPADPGSLARRISDRRFGIGADGLIMLCPASDADVRMEMYNADGSRGEMCGNGIRCLAWLYYESAGRHKNPLSVATDCGI